MNFTGEKSTRPGLTFIKIALIFAALALTLALFIFKDGGKDRSEPIKGENDVPVISESDGMSLELTAATSGTAKPRIAAFNLSLADTIYIDYAISVPEDAESYGVLVWERSAPAEFVHGTGGVEITEGAWQTEYGGEKLWVFAYRGLVIKELADDVYAVPFYKEGGEYVYGKAEKYSVIQYAYAQRNNEKLKPILDSLLSLGTEAQKYFGYRTDRLADSEFVKVSVHGAYLPDGCDFGMFIAGVDTLPVPTAPDGVGGEFDGWYKDAAFTEKLEIISAETTDAYAKWKAPVEQIVKTDFNEKIQATPGSVYNGGVTFNAESQATVETLRDENDTPYLKISSGRDSTIQILSDSVGTSFAEMNDEDVFGFTISLGAESGKKILSTEEFGIQSNKTKSGKTVYAKVNLFTISTSGAVSTYGGDELFTLSSDAASTVRVSVDFKEGTLTYYKNDGTVIKTERFSVPSGLGVTTAKEWQTLIEKYLLHGLFGTGNTIRIYEISIYKGNAFGA